MIVEDQSDVAAFLGDPSSYGLAARVETMETHISRIFLVGDRAFKMKRAVKLPYVDFSTAERRLDACKKEVAFNSAGAPGLYLGIRRIGRMPDGHLAFSDEGQLCDAVVEMLRFKQEDLADRMAVAGKLTPRLMTDVARKIAAFHAAAPEVHAGSGSANIEAVLSINEAGFATSHVFDPAMVRAISRRFRDRLAIHAARLDRREAEGTVRRCHGDLHLRNICVIDGQPLLFDCIEFNDRIATVDTLYDLAFLLMDLWHRGFRHHANLVANRYLDQSGNEDGFILLPFLMAIRAAVRAHVTATQVEESSGKADALIDEARSYFSLASDLLAEAPPRLVAIGGLSGSGKTTLAEALAPDIGMPPGARIVESDRVRKAIHGVSAETRLDASAYRPEMSERVYREMARRASDVLADGGSVVADAVFDRPENRALIEAAAAGAQMRFDGVWLETRPAVLRARVAARHGGPSDADASILALQLGRTLAPIAWRKLDAGRPIASLVQDILKRPAGD
jgi:hypothetical protein